MLIKFGKKGITILAMIVILILLGINLFYLTNINTLESTDIIK